MNRFWGHIWAASFTACLGGLILPACAHDDSSLYIAQIVAPPLGVQNQGCVYQTPSTTTPGLLFGILDVGLASSYAPVALIGNQMTSRADPTQTRTETSRINLRGAVVRVADSRGNQLSTFTSLAEGTVDPQVGTAPGFGLATVTMIDPSTVDSLKAGLPNRAARKTVTTYFKVFGQTLGGVYVESAEFQHVVEVCNGCLVTFPGDANDPTKATPNCSAALAGTGQNLAIPCVAGQDQLMDCRLCQGYDACNPALLR